MPVHRNAPFVFEGWRAWPWTPGPSRYAIARRSRRGPSRRGAGRRSTVRIDVDQSEPAPQSRTGKTIPSPTHRRIGGGRHRESAPHRFREVSGTPARSRAAGAADAGMLPRATGPASTAGRSERVPERPAPRASDGEGGPVSFECGSPPRVRPDRSCPAARLRPSPPRPPLLPIVACQEPPPALRGHRRVSSPTFRSTRHARLTAPRRGRRGRFLMAAFPCLTTCDGASIEPCAIGQLDRRFLAQALDFTRYRAMGDWGIPTALRR